MFVSCFSPIVVQTIKNRRGFLSNLSKIFAPILVGKSLTHPNQKDKLGEDKLGEKIMKSTKIKIKSLLLLLAVFAIGAASLVFLNQTLAAQFFGAIFTSKGDGTSVNQNLYDDKADVYLNGGPQGMSNNGLPDGQYFFQVTDPSGATLLSTDNADCRRLQVVGGRVSGSVAGTSCAGHLNGLYNPANGSTPVQLLPFNDTPNNGGEYKVWLIRQTDTTSIDANDPRVINFQNSNEKSDNFKVRNAIIGFCEEFPDDPMCSPDITYSISGTKFYDSDADGVRDLGEVGFAGIRIEIIFTPELTLEPNPVLRTTDSSGNWSVDGIPLGTSYAVREILPPPCMNGTYWRQTAPAAPGTYSGIVANMNVTGLDFGDLCFRPASGGKTLGFWSNKNGQAIMRSTDNFAGALAFLRNLPLKTTRTGNVDFDPTTYASFRTWLLDGNAVNMAYMLSVQLAATSLDVRYSLLSDAQIVDTTDYNDPLNPLDDDPRIGFASIGFVRQQAILLLTISGYTPSGDPNRVAQELYKDILDDINNNRLPFASTTPCTDEICYPIPTPLPTPTPMP